MISLERAVKIAKEHLKETDFKLADKCTDFREYRVFDTVNKVTPGIVSAATLLIKIKKSTGKLLEFNIVELTQEEFIYFFDSPRVDISEYILSLPI